VVKDKLMVVDVRDRSALGAAGKDVLLGSGAAGLSDFFLTAFKAGLKPLLINIDASGTPGTYADLEKAATAFENAMTPAMAERVRQYLKTPPGQIRGGDKLTAEVRAQIDAAVPRRAIAKPKKPRKLLVTDLNMYVGHATIPHGSYLIELMGKYTGAFEPVFSNDLELLKYPKIKEFDAVFLNNVCGMIWNDPEVRAGVLRYVREGGGMGGHHAVTFANLNWPEFTVMMGGWAGAHHIENQVIKVEDTNSPLTKMFESANFEHVDEYYHFPPYSNYSRQRQHILLSLDVEKSDMATAGRMCPECTRPDHDYALAWIANYGKGRTYFTPLGHMPDFYANPSWARHLLAGIQYLLGDVDADATPSAKLAVKR
jgi:type 1 glutamine amidotransferase